MERIGMSQEERDRLDWLKRAKDGVLSQREAAQKMGISGRGVRKLRKRMKKQGHAVVLHALRGRAGANRKIPTPVQAPAIELLTSAPRLPASELAKRHQLEVGKETLRAWMIEANRWKPGARRIEDIHCWRPRRSGFGERVQWDTSDHDWLEGRGPVRYLVRLIDHATSSTWPCCGNTSKRTDGGRLPRSPLPVHGATPAGREQRSTTPSRPADATGASATAVDYGAFSAAFEPRRTGW